jgi:hypothetical protein
MTIYLFYIGNYAVSFNVWIKIQDRRPPSATPRAKLGRLKNPSVRINLSDIRRAWLEHVPLAL